MEQGSNVSYVLVGLGSVGLRAGESLCRAGLRVSRSAVQVSLRLPLVGPVTAGLASEGRRAAYEIRRVVDASTRGVLADRVLPELLESEFVVALTDQVLASPEMQHAIERIASSPELRNAIAEQSAGMAKEMVGGVRRTSIVLDDVTEQTVRRWLRRRQPGTA